MASRSRVHSGPVLCATIILLVIGALSVAGAAGRCLPAAQATALVSRIEQANQRALQRTLARRKLERTSLEPVSARFESHAALAAWLARVNGGKRQQAARARFRRDQVIETRRGRLVVIRETTLPCGGRQAEDIFVRDRRGVIHRLEVRPRWHRRIVRVCDCPPTRAPGCGLGPAKVIPVYELPGDAKYGGRIVLRYRATAAELHHQQDGCHALPTKGGVP